MVQLPDLFENPYAALDLRVSWLPTMLVSPWAQDDSRVDSYSSPLDFKFKTDIVLIEVLLARLNTA